VTGLEVSIVWVSELLSGTRHLSILFLLLLLQIIFCCNFWRIHHCEDIEDIHHPNFFPPRLLLLGSQLVGISTINSVRILRWKFSKKKKKKKKKLWQLRSDADAGNWNNNNRRGNAASAQPNTHYGTLATWQTKFQSGNKTIPPRNRKKEKRKKKEKLNKSEPNKKEKWRRWEKRERDREREKMRITQQQQQQKCLVMNRENINRK